MLVKCLWIGVGMIVVVSVVVLVVSVFGVFGWWVEVNFVEGMLLFMLVVVYCVFYEDNVLI